MFNELQDYSIIDRKKRKSRGKVYREAVSHTLIGSDSTSDTYWLEFRTLVMTGLHQLHNQKSGRPRDRRKKRISNLRLISPLYLATQLQSRKTQSLPYKPPVRTRRQRKQPARRFTTQILIRN